MIYIRFIYISINNFVLGGNGDPHFLQIVNDKNTNKDIPLCYDISGESGNSIYIIEDINTSSKIFGVLLDDYYMHSIFISQFGRKTVEFSVDKISIFQDNHKIINWENGF